jgi:hypothetical protein
MLSLSFSSKSFGVLFPLGATCMNFYDGVIMLSAKRG